MGNDSTPQHASTAPGAWWAPENAAAVTGAWWDAPTDQAPDEGPRGSAAALEHLADRLSGDLRSRAAQFEQAGDQTRPVPGSRLSAGDVEAEIRRCRYVADLHELRRELAARARAADTDTDCS